MLDWHSCQICYPLEIKILLLLLLKIPHSVQALFNVFIDIEYAMNKNRLVANIYIDNKICYDQEQTIN